AGGAYQFGGAAWTGEVLAAAPPTLLRLAGRAPNGGPFTLDYVLEPVAGGTRMLFTQRFEAPAGDLDAHPNGLAGGWHELFDSLGEWLGGVPIGERLPRTDLAAIAEGWAKAKVEEGAFDAASGERHALDLRREEEVAQLNRRYRERWSAGAAGQGDAGLGRFLNRHTLEFVRVYPHPIERVWRAITEPKELARWFIPTTRWEFQEGGAYRFHDDGFMGEITTIDAPRFVRFGAQPAPGQEPGSFFQYELTPVDGGTRLRFVQYAAPGAVWEGRPEGRNDVPWAGGNLGGWHEYWEALAAHLDGVPADSRLPTTRMGELVADWVGKVQIEYGMDPKLGARIRIGLRREERWAELNALYEKVIEETLPAA
ncbi:MAG TPA: SRPBCC family protein, partial [Caulobacteraceae bacterium]|nr:SRPBCC family protein [Caulobacteraceae bacterium]